MLPFVGHRGRIHYITLMNNPSEQANLGKNQSLSVKQHVVEKNIFVFDVNLKQ